MDVGAKEIVMVLLGFVLAWAPHWFDRRRKIVAHWAALRAEATLCVEKAHILINDNKMAPLYRLPTVAFEKAFPILLVEGELVEIEVEYLTRFFSQAQDINRGLDYATAMRHAADHQKLTQEYSRLVAKASELVGKSGDGGLSKEAFEIFDKKLQMWRLLR